MTGSAAIVVNHNGWKYLKRCLPRLLDQTLPFSALFVVDNGSTDKTRQMLTKDFPNIELLLLNQNVGFSGGVNHGLQHVLRNSQYAYVALVNNDVYLETDWHAQAVHGLETDSRFGSCATCLLQESRPELVDSGGIIWLRPGRAENYLSGQVAPPKDEPYLEIFGASAAAALYRRELFAQIGLFDTALFSYQEDVDLALRARTAGWRCVFIPGARGIHTGHGSNRPFLFNGTYADYYNARNRLAVLVASLPAEEWRLCWRTILVDEFTTLFASLWEHRFVATLAGFTRGLLRLPGVLQRRWKNNEGLS
jgi:GT2 family glycosyltransferase